MKAYLLINVEKPATALAPDVLQVVGVVQAHAVYGGPYDIICFAEAEDMRGLCEIRDTVGTLVGVFAVWLAVIKEGKPSLKELLTAKGNILFIPASPESAKAWVAQKVAAGLLPEGTTWVQVRHALYEAGFTISNTLTSGEARWARPLATAEIEVVDGPMQSVDW